MFIWLLTILLRSVEKNLKVKFAVCWKFIILMKKKRVIAVPLVVSMYGMFTSDLTVQTAMYSTEAFASSQQAKTTLWSEQSNCVTLEL